MSAKRANECHAIRVELPALVAGEVTDALKAAVEQHLSFCPGCQFEWREHELVWRCLQQCDDVDPPEALRDRVRQAVASLE
jgi:anti-sigma factor RsiW